MKIEGTQMQKVVVDVTAQDCLRAIAFHLGIGNLLYPERSGFRYREIRSNKGKGKLTALQPERDISYHGCPCWQDGGTAVTDERILSAYEAVKVLKELL